jgi:hypothetical protein
VERANGTLSTDPDNLKEDPCARLAHPRPDWLHPWVPSRPELISAARAGLSAQLADRVDGHLTTFVAHLREGFWPPRPPSA